MNGEESQRIKAEDGITLYYKKILPIRELSGDEIKKLSSRHNPVMLWREEGTDYFYLAEPSLKSARGASVRFFICFLYNDLTEAERDKYEKLIVEMPFTRKEVTKVYSNKEDSGKPITKKRSLFTKIFKNNKEEK